MIENVSDFYRVVLDVLSSWVPLITILLLAFAGAYILIRFDQGENREVSKLKEKDGYGVAWEHD